MITELVSAADGGIDVVVHAAGVLRGAPTREHSPSAFDEIIDANLRSAYVLVHHALPRIRLGGRIILVSSLSATLPLRGLASYSASKAGMNALAMSVAKEVEDDGINITLVSPGVIDTPMMDSAANSISGLPPSDAGDVIGWVADLPARMVIPELLFRAPFRGPFAAPVGGSGTVGTRFGI